IWSLTQTVTVALALGILFSSKTSLTSATTDALARPGSDAVRHPLRAALVRDSLTITARPSSSIPIMKSARIGATAANSATAAPRRRQSGIMATRAPGVGREAFVGKLTTWRTSSLVPQGAPAPEAAACQVGRARQPANLADGNGHFYRDLVLVLSRGQVGRCAVDEHRGGRAVDSHAGQVIAHRGGDIAGGPALDHPSACAVARRIVEFVDHH